MRVIEILPRLWIAQDLEIIKDVTFFKANNIRYVTNLTYDIPNYFNNVTYFNVPIKDETFNEADLVMSMEQLFDVINQFIIQGYNHGVGILIHDKTGNLALMFSVAFMINKLKLTLKDLIEYLFLHGFNTDYIQNNNYLINYGKKFNNKSCMSY